MGNGYRWLKNTVLLSSVISLIVIFICGAYINGISPYKNGFQIPPVLQKFASLLYQDDPYRTVLEMQRQRKTLLTKMCAKYLPDANKTVKQNPWMFSSDKQLFLYCFVPKVACTSWKRVLSHANGAPENIAVHSSRIYEYVDLFSSLSGPSRRRVLGTYFKFMFVRHPFERVVSAYLDKFISKKNYRQYRQLADKIKRKYSGNASRNDVLTFREFVQFITDPRTPRPLNRHWHPYNELCQPCRIGYDFIGHYETLANDSRYVLDRLGIRDDSRITQTRTVHNSSYKAASLFSQLTGNEIRRLASVYRLDFALFGYDSDISNFLHFIHQKHDSKIF